MDYRTIGIYTDKKEAVFGDSFLVSAEGKKYEIVEFPIGRTYKKEEDYVLINEIKFPLKKNYSEIKVTNTFVFICYKKILCIYDKNGQLIREVMSKDPIIIGNGGFIINDTTKYIINTSSHIHFIDSVENIMNFTDEGVLLFTDNSGDTKIFCMKHSNKIVRFDEDSESIFSFQDYKVYKNSTRIENPIASSVIKLKTRNKDNKDEKYEDCVIITTNTDVFVLFEDIIVKKSLNHCYHKIVPQRFVVHDHINECSIYDCIIVLNCFKSTILYKEDEIEGVLVSFVNSKIYKNLVEALINNLLINSDCIDSKKILCRVYRQIDDESRLHLDRFIPIESLDADQMFYIIIYKPDLVSKFINLCKIQKRLFYLEELRSFYDKTGRSDECKKIFLESGMLIYEYKGLEILNSIEKKQIESQRMEYLSIERRI